MDHCRLRPLVNMALNRVMDIRDLCGYDSFPIARACVEVAAGTYDCLAKYIHYSQ